MFKSKRTEQARLMELEREMDSFLYRLLEDDQLDIEVVMDTFMEMYPGEQQFLEDRIEEYLR